MPISHTLYTTNSQSNDPSKDLRDQGPLVQVLIENPATGANKIVSALIDTGATSCCINKELAKELGLQVVDLKTCHGIGGEEMCPVYYGSMKVLKIDLSYRGSLMGVTLKPTHPIILGRDILAHTVLIYDGVQGVITLAS